MTVEELLNKISYSELVEWSVYYQIEPFGEIRDDYRAGIISSTIANVNRDPKKKAYTVEQFMPKFGREVKPQTWQEQFAIVQYLNQVLNIKNGAK